MKIWKLNGDLFGDLDITLAAGDFRIQGTSKLTLDRGSDFDAAPLLAYNEAVTITYQEGEEELPVTFFQGKCISVPKFADGAGEGQTYEIADAWHDLERTIYQEDWGFGVIAEEDPEAEEPANIHVRADVKVPTVMFGMATAGNRITVGTQIRRAIVYAASVGVAIQYGDIPEGEIPIPSKVSNISCAELIGMCLQLHPDWIPWIDHATSPPTFHVTPVASMTAVEFLADGTGDVTRFNVRKRSDLLPGSVRIVYDFAGEANVDGDPETFRMSYVDKYPAEGPDGGPGVLGAAIPLQGMQMQTQKSRIHTRNIPSAGTMTNEEAREWLKLHYPQLKDVLVSEFTITGWDREMFVEPPDPEDAPQKPINPRSPKLTSNDPDKYPRELVRGSIEDWMRVRVRKMWIIPTINITGTSAACLEAKKSEFKPFTVVATNARTKIYHGPSQWVAPEDIPTGIAQGVYEAIHNGCTWQGDMTMEALDIPVAQMIGKKANITGTAEAGLSEMNAPIQGFAWEIDSGTATIQFGPVPYLAPVDFIQLQRLFRQLPVTWMSAAERTSDKVGAEEDPSSAGDTVGPYDMPETMHTPGGGAGTPCSFGSLEAGKIKGGPVTCGSNNWHVADWTHPAFTSGLLYVYLVVDQITVQTDDDDQLILPGVVGNAVAPYITSGSSYPDTIHPETPTDTTGSLIVPLGVMSFLDPGYSFDAAACGPITVTQCGGILGYERL